MISRPTTQSACRPPEPTAREPSHALMNTTTDLADALQARTDPVAAERAIARALVLAPADIEMRLAAYRFYFYSHRLADALPHAEFIIRHAARRLNIAQDWTAVHARDVAFDCLEEVPGLYLQALLAWGYCKIRLQAWDEGCRALVKVAELDARDRFGSRRLLRVIEAASNED